MIHFATAVGDNRAFIEITKEQLYRSIKEMYAEQEKLIKNTPEWHQASGKIKLLSTLVENLEEKENKRRIRLSR
jgi:thymidylate synthase